MVKGRGKKLNNQRGSATIEAVVGFTAFLFAIFTILGLVNFCRAQMLVSSAVDTAAKEMSQYAYFYQMSGLQKFEEQLDKNASVGKNNINEVIGTVDQLYGSINGAVEQTTQDAANVADMLAAGNMELQTFENAIGGLENSAEGVMQGITGVGNAMKDVGNDPLIYMRSLVALIGSEGMEVAKRAVAVPLARAFVSKHFGDTTAEANKELESLGIEGGLDSMNFNLSNIFSDDAHQDIEITVIYKVKLLQVFEWVVLEANVSKVAVCRAWLGGDDVIVKAVSSEQPPLGTDSSTTKGEENSETTESTDSSTTEGDKNDETSENTGPTEETTEPDEDNTVTNTSTGNWALQHDPTGYYHSKRCEEFQKKLRSDYHLNNFTPYFEFQETAGEAVGVDSDVYARWEFEAYETMGGNIREPGVDMLRIPVEHAVKGMAETHKKLDGTVQEFGAYLYVVYVPENMPESQYSALRKDADKVEAEMKELIKNDTTGIPKDLAVNIVIVRSGGQYDYNSQEEDYTHIGGVGLEE